MEIVDELMTPGCPNCARKHLSAAVERVVDGLNVQDRRNADVLTILARAYINFIEAAEGYLSHRDYAVGLLVAAEERLVRRGDTEYAKAIRAIRTGLMENPTDLEALYIECVDRLALAHIHEAFRELPELSYEFDRNCFGSCSQETVDKLVAMIRWIDERYFLIKPEEPGKGGESTMACGTKKTVKAACKGGKCGGKKGGCKK